MLDHNTEEEISRICGEVKEAFGERLVCLALYGSGAGKDFVPGQSDLNLAIVLDEVDFDALKRLHRHLPDWHRLGAATPLLMDREFIERARSVFPMELQDIRAEHRVLAGEDVFANAQVDRDRLRYELEQEATGKLLRLRALFAEVGADDDRLKELMIDSVKTFLVIMRSMIRVDGREGSIPYLELLDQFEGLYAQYFPRMRELLNLKLHGGDWPDDVEAMFEVYAQEVKSLVAMIDRVFAATT